MRRARRIAGLVAAALALVCVSGCGAYAPAEWPDNGAGEEREEPDGD